MTSYCKQCHRSIDKGEFCSTTCNNWYEFDLGKHKQKKKKELEGK